MIISACLVLLKAMLRLQASWYSQPTYLQVRSKTVPNKRSVNRVGTDLEISPNQICDRVIIAKFVRILYLLLI